MSFSLTATMLSSHLSHWLNLRLGYSPGRFGLSFWLRNLTDEDIETRGFFFGNDPRIGYAEAAYTQLRRA